MSAMTNKKKAKDNSDVDVDPEIKNLKRLDRESVSIGQSRLTDPLLMATEARYVLKITPRIHSC